MSHFTDEVWADYARGTLSPSEAASVSSHVEAGCSGCGHLLQTWARVAGILRREMEYEPPAGVVDEARSLFTPEEVESPALGDRRFANLVFDSFASPVPVGLRTIERSTRQLCFKSGSYYVDLRIEEHPGTAKASVIGQLIRVPYNERVRLEGLSVTLSSGNASLSSTTTNRLGEFQLEVPTDGEHNIALGVGEGFAMVVRLRALRRGH